MKFSKFREFRISNYEIERTVEQMRKYLAVDLLFSLRELFTGLSRLKFEENFDAFKTTVTVPSGGADFAIRNELSEAPTGKIILRDGGASTVVDGDTTWTSDYVYLKNTGGSDVTVTVVFFK